MQITCGVGAAAEVRSARAGLDGYRCCTPCCKSTVRLFKLFIDSRKTFGICKLQKNMPKTHAAAPVLKSDFLTISSLFIVTNDILRDYQLVEKDKDFASFTITY